MSGGGGGTHQGCSWNACGASCIDFRALHVRNRAVNSSDLAPETLPSLIVLLAPLMHVEGGSGPSSPLSPGRSSRISPRCPLPWSPRSPPAWRCSAPPCSARVLLPLHRSVLRPLAPSAALRAPVLLQLGAPLAAAPWLSGAMASLEGAVPDANCARAARLLVVAAAATVAAAAACGGRSNGATSLRRSS